MTDVDTRRIGRWIGPLGLGIVAVAVFLIPGVAGSLELTRAGMAHGEWWRMVTGHLTHFTGQHLFWDVATMLVLGWMVAGRSVRRWWWTAAGSAVVISLGVLAFLPEVEVYRGLSGVDSALFACLAVMVMREGVRERRWAISGVAALAMAGFLGKTLYELVTGRVLFVQDLGAGVSPVVLAHVIGAAWGIGVGMVGARVAGCLADWDWVVAGE